MGNWARKTGKEIVTSENAKEEKTHRDMSGWKAADKSDNTTQRDKLQDTGEGREN